MTMITPSYLGETIEYSSLHACRSTLEDPTSEDEAITIANDSRYGLHGAVIGTDVDRARRVASQLRRAGS